MAIQILAGGGKPTRSRSNKQGGRNRANNYEETAKKWQEDPSYVSLPKVFEIIKSDGMSTCKKKIGLLYCIPLDECLSMLVCVTGNPCHIRVLCEGENLPRSFSHPSQWDSEVLAFTKDVMEGIIPPTVHIKEDRWAPMHWKFLTKAAAEMSILDLGANETALRNNTAAE